MTTQALEILAKSSGPSKTGVDDDFTGMVMCTIPECGHCVQQTPVFEELSRNYKGVVAFRKMTPEELPKAWKLKVQQVPSYFYIDSTMQASEIATLEEIWKKCEALSSKADTLCNGKASFQKRNL
tara:strand:- start:1491 stop:1865 length:375 start_codon:yes stop_codon:yes gene_type:complete